VALGDFDNYRERIETALEEAKADLPVGDQDRLRHEVKQARGRQASAVNAPNAKVEHLALRLLNALKNAEQDLSDDQVKQLEAVIQDGLPNI
jgi:hypothetical protein